MRNVPDVRVFVRYGKDIFNMNRRCLEEVISCLERKGAKVSKKEVILVMEEAEAA